MPRQGTVPPAAWDSPKDSVLRADHNQLPCLCTSGGTQSWAPRRSPGGRGNHAEAPGLGSPSPTAITGNEREQEKPNRRLAIPSPQVSFLNTPFPPLPRRPQSPSILDTEGALSLKSLGKILSRDNLSLQEQEKQEAAPLLALSTLGPRERGHTGVSGGF